MAHARRHSTVRFPAEAARSPHRTSTDLPTSPSSTLEPDAPFQQFLVSGSLRARDLVDVPAVVVGGEAAVEEACGELLRGGGAACLIVQSGTGEMVHQEGLFDYADANSFLLLGLNARILAAGQVEDPRTSEILHASRQGVVPIRLACNISQKNPMEVRDEDASLETLLQIYAAGTHRVVIHPSTSPTPSGIATDLSLISYLLHAPHPSLRPLLERPLFAFGIGDLPTPVISATIDSTILDAMVLMDGEGVNSIAVLDRNGNLHSAVSVTDIGRLVIPSQSKDVLGTRLGQFVSRIKWTAGATDGADHFPVYSVVASSTLEYTMEKLVATKAHRLFLVADPLVPTSPSPFGNLRGVVSVVDVLSIFARLAGIPDVDPFRLRRKRRTSSTSSRSSGHSRHSSVSMPTPPSSVSSLSGEPAGK
ncbi:hypothetical protein CALVIDRAFT_539290 [Calocera viscosa TUFC12733]|uniref:CBS domain-containing protein n=1 Tax=Calocera viscosa (strain TUFC12733) TaxID=1330018 RepID=A0A167K4G5_CALVF|nr:hypothetical protein CALVIDRAFT_539290 [Calocera viscosa TUFC12733]